MKTHVKFSFLLFFTAMISHAQINTATGGATSVLPNSPTSNTNVGIGTNAPTQKLEVVGTVKATKAIFPGNELSNQTYASWDAGVDASIFLSGGKLNPLYPNRRLFNVYDMSMTSPYVAKLVGLGLADRVGRDRFTVNLFEGSGTELALYDATGTGEFFKVKDYGDANGAYLQMGKPNTKVIIGGFSNDPIVGDRKFIVKGNSLLQGKVCIGGDTANPFGIVPVSAGGVNVSTYGLFVKGGILTEEVRVNSIANWADYVFKKDYNLKSLAEVEDFIKENGHLPNVPSAAEVKEDGISLSQMAKIQQEKIEELTLYIIELNKKLETQEKRLNELGQKQ
jgi:hypothetical protein